MAIKISARNDAILNINSSFPIVIAMRIPQMLIKQKPWQFSDSGPYEDPGHE